MVGQSAVAALAPLQNAMNIQTTDGHMMARRRCIGMKVLKGLQHDKDKSGDSLDCGAVTKDAMFSLSYKNMTAGRMALARRRKICDWKAHHHPPAQTK